MSSKRAFCLLPGLLILLAACGDRPTTHWSGYVEGDYLRASSPMAGRLLERPVHRGDLVKAGDLLFRLDPDNETQSRDEAAARLKKAEAELGDARKGRRAPEIESLDAQLLQAKASLERTTTEYKRFEELAGTKAVSASTVDEARSASRRDAARVTDLEAQLKLARMGAREDMLAAAEAGVEATRQTLARQDWMLSQKVQKATGEAKVEDTLFEPGEWVPAGSPVLTLLPPGNLKIRFFVPEPEFAKVSAGQPLKIRMDGVTDLQDATVSYISPRAEFTPPVIYSRESRQKLVFLCEARLTSTNKITLHPGQPVEVLHQ